MNKRIQITLLMVAFLASTLMLAGCSSMRKSRPVEDVAGLPQVASFADDIKDINVPSELVWDRTLMSLMSSAKLAICGNPPTSSTGLDFRIDEQPASITVAARKATVRNVIWVRLFMQLFLRFW